LLLGACGPRPHTAAVRLDRPVELIADRQLKQPSPTPSWLTTTCTAPSDLRATPLHGRGLMWNATGTAIVVLPDVYTQAASVVALGSREPKRLPLYGSISAIPGTDAFLVWNLSGGGELASAVITPQGNILGDCSSKQGARLDPTSEVVPLSATEVCWLAEKKLVKASEGRADRYASVAVFPGKQALQVVADEQVNAWDTRQGAPTVNVAVPARALPLKSSANGEHLVALKVDPSLSGRRDVRNEDVLLWKAGVPAPWSLGRVQGGTEVAFSASGRWLWAEHIRETLLFGVATRARVTVPLRHIKLASAVDAAVGVDREANPKTLRVWRPQLPLATVAFDGTPEQWDIDANATRVAVAAGRRMTLYDLTTKRVSREVTATSPVTQLAFRPGSTDLAVLTADGLELLSADGRLERWVELRDTAVVSSMALSEAGDALELVLQQPTAALQSLSLTTGAMRDRVAAAGAATAGVSSSDGRYRLEFGDRGSGKLRGPATPQTVELQAPPELESIDAPTWRAAAFNESTQRVLGVQGLGRPRSMDTRLAEWDMASGLVTWVKVTQGTTDVIATRAGWIVNDGSEVSRYERQREVYSQAGVYAYAPATDELAIARGSRLTLVGPDGKARLLPLPSADPALGLSFDRAGGLLAVGTRRGMQLIDLTAATVRAEFDWDGEVTPLGFHGQLAIGQRSLGNAEASILLLDATSSAWLSVGFLRLGSRNAEVYAIASNGRSDGHPDVLAALHGSAPSASSCVEAGLIARWLREAAP
jgi:hypothetical protein